MTESALFALPWPPTVNTYWRAVNGRNIISRRGREYREEAAWIIRAERANLELDCPLAVTVNLYPPDMRKRDIDNVCKALLDALQHGGVYKDDSQIMDLRLTKGQPLPYGKAVVHVRRFVG